VSGRDLVGGGGLGYGKVHITLLPFLPGLGAVVSLPNIDVHAMPRVLDNTLEPMV
jgi:hypothetical protein